MDLERGFTEGAYLSEARTPYPRPLHTLYSVYVYTVYLVKQGRGKRGNRGEYRSHSRV